MNRAPIHRRAAIVADGPQRLNEALAALPEDERGEVRERLDLPSSKPTQQSAGPIKRLLAEPARWLALLPGFDHRCYHTQRPTSKT